MPYSLERHWPQAETAPIIPSCVHLLPASCPALAAAPGLSPRWQLPQGCGDELPSGRTWASPTAPRGHSAWLRCLHSLASHHLEETSAPPVSKLGQWPELVSARLRENPTPHVVEASAFRGLLFRNMSQSGNPAKIPVAQRSWCDGGMTLDIALPTGLKPLPLRNGPASSLWSDHHTVKRFVPPLPTLSIKEQNQTVLVHGPLLFPMGVSSVALAQHTGFRSDYMLQW